ncbi:MAG: glycosyltransferase family protein [Flavobacteriaceae bacterium]|nr:glycosyltransferase family protein [Flavobacteriaceae bacterium]
MKILYAIQGTGNGHISVAMELIPLLKRRADLDILISGRQVELDLPFEINHRKQGFGFIFGKNGGIDFIRTLKTFNLKVFFKEIMTLPIRNYDLVISDFEPVSAWAARLKNIPCIALSHQAAVLHSSSPKPGKADPISKFLLGHYAPSDKKIGFHYKNYSSDILTPVIRKEIRERENLNLGYYTVYLPAFSDKKIIAVLSMIRNIRWEVFSKNSLTPYQQGNVFISPVNNEAFVQSLTACEGVLCNAGFETTAEALFLGKKLLVVPMKFQLEQQCNVVALKEMGVSILKKFKKSNLSKIKNWVKDDKRVYINYPNHSEEIIDRILNMEFDKNWKLTEEDLYADLI